MLGGLAVISHGHSRPTHDADIWLDPLLPLADWISLIFALRERSPDLRFLEIGSWNEIPDEAFSGVIERDGVFRMM